VVDLRITSNVKVIPDDAKVWVAHAGVGKVFFKLFQERSVIFLDLPFLEITPEDFLSTVDLRQKIQMSEEIKGFLLRGGDFLKSENPPATDFKAYDELLADRGLNAQVGNVRAMYNLMKPGDLVLIPPKGGQYGEVLFGEIVNNDIQEIAIRDIPGYSVKARKVRWLTRSLQKREMSSGLSRRLENRHAVIEIASEDLIKEVYSLAYQNVVTKDFSKMEIVSPKYKSKDGRHIIKATEFISFLVSIFPNIVNENNIDPSLDVRQILAIYYNTDLIDEFQIEFSSPGLFRIFSKNRALILFLIAAIPILKVLPVESSDQAKVVGVSLGSSDGLVEERLMISPLDGMLMSLTPAQKRQAVDMARDSDAKIGLSTGAVVVIENTPGLQ
jgi:hypothetical protein